MDCEIRRIPAGRVGELLLSSDSAHSARGLLAHRRGSALSADVQLAAISPDVHEVLRDPVQVLLGGNLADPRRVAPAERPKAPFLLQSAWRRSSAPACSCAWHIFCSSAIMPSQMVLETLCMACRHPLRLLSSTRRHFRNAFSSEIWRSRCGTGVHNTQLLTCSCWTSARPSLTVLRQTRCFLTPHSRFVPRPYSESAARFQPLYPTCVQYPASAVHPAPAEPSTPALHSSPQLYIPLAPQPGPPHLKDEVLQRVQDMLSQFLQQQQWTEEAPAPLAPRVSPPEPMGETVTVVFSKNDRRPLEPLPRRVPSRSSYGTPFTVQQGRRSQHAGRRQLGPSKKRAFFGGGGNGAA